MFLGTLTCHKNINIINEHEELKGRRDGGGMERERKRRHFQFLLLFIHLVLSRYGFDDICSCVELFGSISLSAKRAIWSVCGSIAGRGFNNLDRQVLLPTINLKVGK